MHSGYTHSEPQEVFQGLHDAVPSSFPSSSTSTISSSTILNANIQRDRHFGQLILHDQDQNHRLHYKQKRKQPESPVKPKGKDKHNTMVGQHPDALPPAYDGPLTPLATIPENPPPPPPYQRVQFDSSAWLATTTQQTAEVSGWANAITSALTSDKDEADVYVHALAKIYKAGGGWWSRVDSVWGCILPLNAPSSSSPKKGNGIVNWGNTHLEQVAKKEQVWKATKKWRKMFKDNVAGMRVLRRAWAMDKGIVRGAVAVLMEVLQMLGKEGRRDLDRCSAEGWDDDALLDSSECVGGADEVLPGYGEHEPSESAWGDVRANIVGLLGAQAQYVYRAESTCSRCEAERRRR